VADVAADPVEHPPLLEVHRFQRRSEPLVLFARERAENQILKRVTTFFGRKHGGLLPVRR
jgi:hypothetical protein